MGGIALSAARITGNSNLSGCVVVSAIAAGSALFCHQLPPSTAVGQMAIGAGAAAGSDSCNLHRALGHCHDLHATSLGPTLAAGAFVCSLARLTNHGRRDSVALHQPISIPAFNIRIDRASPAMVRVLNFVLRSSFLLSDRELSAGQKSR